MKNHTLLACVCSAAVGLLTASNAADAPTATTVQSIKEFSYRSDKSAQLKYLLFLPKGYQEEATKKWPVLLFLHGAGERGSDVWKVAVHGPPKIVAQRPDFPFIVVSPQCPEDRIWDRDVLLGLLDDVLGTYRVDASRVYLTGLSMGGYGTWDLGLTHPDRFAAIAPICGGGNIIAVLLAPRGNQAPLKRMGIWAFHGGKDPVVPLVESQRMIEVLNRVGSNQAKLTVYPEANHDSWTETYNNPKFYEWLLEHRRE